MRGHQIRVLLPNDVPTGWLMEELRRRQVNVVKGPLAVARRRYLRVTSLLSLIWRFPAAILFVRRQMAAFRPDVVHINTLPIMAGIAARPHPGQAVIWHVHEIPEPRSRLAWVLRTLPGVSGAAIIAVSNAVAAALSSDRRLASNLTVVANGIANRQYPNRARRTLDEPRIAFVGRLNGWKGYEVFVEAVAILAGEFRNAVFFIAGSPPPGEEWREAHLRDRIAAAALASRIRILGVVDDVPHLLDDVDLLVCPTLKPDPFPTVMLEALRSGCPIVASRHGGAAEIIEDGVSGLLVPPGDAPAVATAVRGLLTDPRRLAAMKRNARSQFVQKFGLDRFVDEVEEIYKEATNRTHSGFSVRQHQTQSLRRGS